MSDNETKNIMPANTDQEELAYYDEYQDFHGMNRFLMLLIAAAMIPWLFGGYVILGFNVTGWAWVVGMVVSSLVGLRNILHISFPIALWLPWIATLIIYWFLGRHNPNALQSLFQMLSPLAVGCAASVFRPEKPQLEDIIRWITRLAWVACALLLVRMPMILTGVLPGHGFMTAEMIGLLLLGACYVSFYACGSGRHLYHYLAVLAITVASLTRGPIVAMLSCVPLTLAPFKMHKRVILCACVILVSLFLFNSDRVQQRMFYTGGGGLTDLRWNNPNLRTSGRSAMFDVLWPGVKDRPLLGNGFNHHRVELLNAGFILYLPHNDWLKLIYDVGIVGTGLYLFSMLFQVFWLLRIARESAGALRMLAYATATAFVPYSIIMLTDNVILYVQFFGNLHFALIGIVYGALKKENEASYDKDHFILDSHSTLQ